MTRLDKSCKIYRRKIIERAKSYVIGIQIEQNLNLYLSHVIQIKFFLQNPWGLFGIESLRLYIFCTRRGVRGLPGLSTGCTRYSARLTGKIRRVSQRVYPCSSEKLLSSIVNLLLGTADSRNFCIVTYFSLRASDKNNKSSFKLKLAAMTSQEVEGTVRLGITVGTGIRKDEQCVSSTCGTRSRVVNKETEFKYMYSNGQ